MWSLSDWNFEDLTYIEPSEFEQCDLAYQAALEDSDDAENDDPVQCTILTREIINGPDY